MLKELKFVQGAVKRNVTAPELEHYQLKGGRATGFNGYMALSAPIALDLEAKPKADLFYRALAACGDAISLRMTAAGRLHVKSGGFSAFVPCIEKEVYEASPTGEMHPAPDGLLDAFRRLLPLVSEDATRPWAMGLLVDRGAYTATNNVVILQVWGGHSLPTFNCPRFAVAEVCRIGEQPTGLQIDASSVTFHYSDGRWLRTQLLASEWPADKMNSILGAPCSPMPLPDETFAAIEKLMPFIASDWSPIYFRDGAVSTSEKEGNEEGVTVDVPGLPGGAIFNAKSLRLVAGEAQRIDLTLHPRPCIFYGDRSRGAIIGMTH